MSLIQIQLPLHSFERLVKVLERIAEACERAYPALTDADDPTFKEPTSGVTIVTDEMLLEEEVRERLRLQGYMPDDIEAMISENESAVEERLDG